MEKSQLQTFSQFLKGEDTLEEEIEETPEAGKEEI